MVRDLEQIDGGQATLHEPGIDAVLDVAGQQEAPTRDLAKQDDRRVVDARPVVGSGAGHRARVRPEDPEADVVDDEPRARREHASGNRQGAQPLGPRGIPGPRAGHRGLEDSGDRVPAQQDGQAGHVILVWVGQDDRVDAPIPRRELRIERNEETVRIWTAVHEQSSSATTLDENRIALPDVEDRDCRESVGPVNEGEAGGDDGDCQSGNDNATGS